MCSSDLVPRKDATGFGVMAIDDQWKITDFVEKPADPPPMPGKPDASLCSMGIYIFNAKYLYSERAVGEVTGSAYLLEVGDSKVLVDCGMYQGLDSDRKNAEPAAVDLSGLDAVLLTHAHIDHSGRLPLLVKQGFKGKILATDPTIELSKVLLRDTAHLMAEEAE